MTRLARISCLAVLGIAAVAACGSSPEQRPAGGAGTVFDSSASAFGFAARNLSPEHQIEFRLGHAFFDQNWVTAPASTTARDGLGPLFNQRSCSACHFKAGRSQPPPAGQPMKTMLMRISIPGSGPHGEPVPDPVYGLQIQGAALLQFVPEAEVHLEYQNSQGEYEDGEPFVLQRPAYFLRKLGYGPPNARVRMSARVAPALLGLGLLEAVPESALQEVAARQIRQGLAGRIHYVWDPVEKQTVPGRFGWKAEQPSLLLQTAVAFAEDLGITSTLIQEENHPDQRASPNGGSPEVSDRILRAVTTYARLLAVPAQRDWNSPLVQHGEALFERAGCAACHLPELRTGDWPEYPELSNQIIRPYTDLLIHDLGEGLSDDRPVFQARGRDWRTAPLWGIGLMAKVSGHTRFLHDGRARNLSEAILWHGGEAGRSADFFRSCSPADRAALLAFLESL